MCGLVGMAGNVVDQDKKALMLLMRFDVCRGFDATGLAVVTDKDSKINVHKKVGPPEYLFSEDDAFNAMGVYTGERGKVFIGHNRAATKGKVIDANAHPFLHDGIVGAHNGTLTSVSTLEKGYKFDVDSEAIFYNLSLYDAESVINNIYGAYALTWYDDSSETLNIIRNVERPLYYTRRTDKDVIYWASEEWMLRWALVKTRISHGEIKAFDTDTLYTLDVSSCLPSAFRTVDWETKKDVKGYTPPPPKKYAAPKNNGGGKSNIIPFVGGKPSSKPSRSNADIMMMKMMVDTNIQFKFSEVKKGMGGSEYLSAYPNNPQIDFDIRVYGDKHTNWDYWKTHLHNTVFKGRVKKVVDNQYTAVREVYFLIDLRSIVPHAETLPKDDKKEEVEDSLPFEPLKDELSDGDPTMYEGFQGRFLTEEEWLRATSNGCAGCGEEASKHDCDLVFIDHAEFLCGVNHCNETYAEHIPTSAYQ